VEEKLLARARSPPHFVFIVSQARTPLCELTGEAEGAVCVKPGNVFSQPADSLLALLGRGRLDELNDHFRPSLQLLQHGKVT